MKLILIAGPCRSGTGDDPELLAKNVRLMESYALPILRAGHVPVVFRRHAEAPRGRRVTFDRACHGIIVIVSAELDAMILEKRSQLKDAFAAHQKARDAAARAHRDLAGVASDCLVDARAEIQRLETEEREAATRFNTISGEVAELHRVKYGEWHFIWRGPRPSR